MLGLGLALLATNSLALRLGMTGAIVWAFGVGVVVIVRRQAAGGDALSLVSLVSIDLFLGFAVGGVFLQLTGVHDPRLRVLSAHLTSALVLGGVAWIFFVLGSRIRLGRPAVLNLAQKLWTPGNPRFGRLLILYGLGWCGRIIQVMTGRYFHVVASEVVSTKTSLLVHGLALLPAVAMFILFARGHPAKAWYREHRFAAGILVMVELAWYFPSGARANIVAIGLGMCVLYYYDRGVFPVKMMAFGVAVTVVMVFPVVAQYRGNNADYQQDVSAAAAAAFRSNVEGGVLSGLSTGVQATLSRFSDVLSAATVFSRPDVQESDRFRTLWFLLTAPIPRAALPSKPDPGLYGNEFGRRYRLIQPWDRATSIAISQPLELYLMGNWAAVLMGMLVIGYVYSLLDVVFLRRRDSPAALGVYAALAFSFMTSVGVIFAHGFVGLVKQLVIVLICLRGTGVITGGAHARRSIGLVPGGGVPTR